MRLSPIDIQLSRATAHGTMATIGERVLFRAVIVPVAIPKTSARTRVGVSLRIDGRFRIHPFVEQRLLSTAYEVMIHDTGACSIPREAALGRPLIARA